LGFPAVINHLSGLRSIHQSGARKVAFSRLQKPCGFTVVDANRSVDAVTKQLRKEIRALCRVVFKAGLFCS
jgi:thymidylate kinase